MVWTNVFLNSFFQFPGIQTGQYPVWMTQKRTKKGEFPRWKGSYDKQKFPGEHAPRPAAFIAC